MGLGAIVFYLEVNPFGGMSGVSSAAANNVEPGIVRALTLTVVVILATLIVLYPIIILLNKGLFRLSSALLKSNVELMEVLGSAIAKRDADTHVHNYRVTIYAIRLAEEVGLSAHNIRRLMTGAFLHDVGKIGIADAVLRKPDTLTSEEAAVLRRHVALEVDIIAKSNWLGGAREEVEFHHEKFDGSGYMKGLKGEAIPLNARIFAIVDVFDALTSRRPYKVPFSFDETREIMRRGRGSHFDPRLLDTFYTIAPQLFAQVNGAEDTAVEAILRGLVNQYFLSFETLPRTPPRPVAGR